VKTIRRGRGGRKRVRVGPSDPSLTGHSGMVAVNEVVDKLAVVGALDEHIPAIKTRDRGLSAGELVLSVACAQLLGQDALVGLDTGCGPIPRGSSCGRWRRRPRPRPGRWRAGSVRRSMLVSRWRRRGWRLGGWACCRRVGGRRWCCGRRRSTWIPPRWRCSGGPRRGWPQLPGATSRPAASGQLGGGRVAVGRGPVGRQPGRAPAMRGSAAPGGQGAPGRAVRPAAGPRRRRVLHRRPGRGRR